MLGPVLLGLLIIVASGDGIVPLLLPGGWAVLAVLLGVVEGAYESHVLVHVSSYIIVIDRHVSQVLVLVDQEGSSKGEAGPLDEHAVVLGDVLGEVTEEVDVQRSSESSVPRKIRFLGFLTFGQRWPRPCGSSGSRLRRIAPRC